MLAGVLLLASTRKLHRMLFCSRGMMPTGSFVKVSELSSVPAPSTVAHACGSSLDIVLPSCLRLSPIGKIH